MRTWRGFRMNNDENPIPENAYIARELDAVAAQGFQREKAIERKVAPSQAVDVLKEDLADNRILECAAHAKSVHVVTSVKGLLSLGNFEGIAIVSVAGFLEIVWRQSKGHGP